VLYIGKYNIRYTLTDSAFLKGLRYFADPHRTLSIPNPSGAVPCGKQETKEEAASGRMGERGETLC